MAGATISSTILRQLLITLPKATASLRENLLMESLVSSIMRVSSRDFPSSNTMPVCALGLIQTSDGPSRLKSLITGM